MRAPLSFLKEYIDIRLSPKALADKLTEVGIGVEKINNIDGDTIFELEITPNRPDCLSIIGIAQEIAAIENKKIQYPKLTTDFSQKPKKTLPIEIKTDSKINPRFSAVIIDNVSVKESPKWLKDRLTAIGQRPINNIVDITNYVMFELGNPIHAFDYDKIKGHVMKVHLAKGGEPFKSVDGISYRLPKGAVVISDSQNIIDLCGIKGGYNSATFETTKTILVRVPVEQPELIRKASLSLGLRSDASSIFEKGVNAGGTIDALRRCVDLILEISGADVASELYDLKKEGFEPWKLSLRSEKMNKLLGIAIPQKKAFSILESLNLQPKLSKDQIDCTIPTYRNDLKIEEDLIEEVARLYGYNNFPKTIPSGAVPTVQVPYFKDYRIDERVKEYLKAVGFSEIYSYALVSENDIIEQGLNPDQVLRVDNPISREYEYLRPTLKIGLKKAMRQNRANADRLSFFELGKVYRGKSIDSARQEYCLAGITNEKEFAQVKGILEKLIDDYKIKGLEPLITIEEEGIAFELNYSLFLEKQRADKIFKPLPKYPPVIEDIALVVKEKTPIADIIEEIKKQSPLVAEVSLLDQFEDTKTFHIVYQDPQKNLTNEEVSKIREKTLKALSEKFDISAK